jgi:hypothetical protein
MGKKGRGTGPASPLRPTHIGHPPTQPPVLNRLRHMAGADGLAPSQIRDRTGDLQNPVERPGGEPELLEGAVEHGEAGVVDPFGNDRGGFKRIGSIRISPRSILEM